MSQLGSLFLGGVQAGAASENELQRLAMAMRQQEAQRARYAQQDALDRQQFEYQQQQDELSRQNVEFDNSMAERRLGFDQNKYAWEQQQAQQERAALGGYVGGGGGGGMPTADPQWRGVPFQTSGPVEPGVAGAVADFTGGMDPSIVGALPKAMLQGMARTKYAQQMRQQAAKQEAERKVHGLNLWASKQENQPTLDFFAGVNRNDPPQVRTEKRNAWLDSKASEYLYDIDIGMDKLFDEGGVGFSPYNLPPSSAELGATMQRRMPLARPGAGQDYVDLRAAGMATQEDLNMSGTSRQQQAPMVSVKMGRGDTEKTLSLPRGIGRVFDPRATDGDTQQIMYHAERFLGDPETSSWPEWLGGHDETADEYQARVADKARQLAQAAGWRLDGAAAGSDSSAAPDAIPDDVLDEAVQLLGPGATEQQVDRLARRLMRGR